MAEHMINRSKKTELFDNNELTQWSILNENVEITSTLFWTLENLKLPEVPRPDVACCVIETLPPKITRANDLTHLLILVKIRK